MKTLAFFFLLFFSLNLFAQSNEVSNVDVKINIISSLQIYYYFYFKDSVDENCTFSKIREIKAELVNLTDGSKVNNISCSIGTNPLNVVFRLTLKNSNKELVEKIFSKDYPTYLSVSEPIHICMPDGKEDFIISPEKIKMLTMSTKALNDDQKQLLLNNLNANSPDYRNNISFSRSINEDDTTKSEYIVEFDIQKPFLSDVVGSLFYYRLKGRASTDIQNPFNTLEAYIIYNIQKQFYIEVGRIGPQKFNVNSLRANIGYETLIPNLIDLTGGKPRLRLKPYINWGIAFQQNFQMNNPFGNKEGNLLLFASGYYYVPVRDKFAIIAEGKVIYSDKFTSNEKLLFNYKISFGYETPLSDLNVLFQVVNGKNEVNIGEATTYSLGLLLNFIPF